VQAYEPHNACISCVYIRVGRGHRAGMRIYVCINTQISVFNC